MILGTDHDKLLITIEIKICVNRLKEDLIFGFDIVWKAFIDNVKIHADLLNVSRKTKKKNGYK